MTIAKPMSLTLAAVLIIAAPIWSQESDSHLEEKAQETLESARETAGAVAEAVDKNKQAQEVSAGILKPIYGLAEAFSFPAFHWIAFAVMVTGVVSFALQLTLGKLVVLARLGFSPAEFLSDALGLVVSLVGLALSNSRRYSNVLKTRRKHQQSLIAARRASLCTSCQEHLLYRMDTMHPPLLATAKKSAVIGNR